MTLQRKFALLLAVLGAVVAINLGTVLWAVTVLQHELAWPLVSIQRVMRGLDAVKRAVEEAAAVCADAGMAREAWPARALRASPGSISRAEAEPRLRQISERMSDAIDTLERVDSYLIRSGISTTRNLRSSLDDASGAVLAWARSGDAASEAEAGRGLFRVHELIERIEGQIIRDADIAVVHQQDVRESVLWIIGVSVVLVLGTALLALKLLRRWVVKPVGDLRQAAARIAQGDFAHRIGLPPGDPGRDELVMLSAEVNHMAGMIASMQEERVERERLAAVGEMVRRIVHNLRNPLAGIRSLAELTRSELARDPALRENQDRIIGTVDRFEGWLGGLLNVSRPLDVRPAMTTIGPWMEAVVSSLRAMAQGRGVVLGLDTRAAPDRASFDPAHLEQAVIAVATNAIQASPAGSQVDVVAAACEGGRDWEVRVSDRGPGVPVEWRERIFRPYFTTKRDGSGIGLAMAKQVVEQHGGRIWVESRAKSALPTAEAVSGSVFVLSLPIGATATVARVGQTGAHSGQNSDHRGRGEPAVLHPPGDHQGGS